MTREIREVHAKACREGYSVFFFERGGKYRLDFLEETKEKREEIKKRLGAHFQSIMKIVFRGRNGGEKDRWLGILAFLYERGKIVAGQRIVISRGIEKGIREAIFELEKIDENLAWVYGEERVVFGNEIEVLGVDDEFSESFEGEGREEFEGMSAEEWFYRKILVPEIEECGGKRADIISQMMFGSLLGERKFDERRADFFVSPGEEKGMVIEIDDETHKNREEKDEERDKLIRANRFRVFRIRDEELKDVEKARKKLGKSLSGLYEAIGASNIMQDEGLSLEGSGNAVMLKKRSERDFEAFEGKIMVGDKAENEIFLREVNFPYGIVNYRIKDDLGRIKFNVREGIREKLEWLFEYIFGFKGFKEGQFEAILRILEGDDAIVLLPTGAGKSAIFQFLMLIMPGVGVVAEPLRALMEDQVGNLEKRGIDLAVNMSEDMTLPQKRRVYELIKEGAFGMIYVTPERIQMEEFRRVLAEAKERGVRFFVVALDEAHCVSEWGHDFRVSYLSLADTARKILRYKDEAPRIIALTGTASDNVLRDMERDIGITEEKVIQPRSFDRPEIHFRVVKVSSGEKMTKLEEIMEMIKNDFPGFSEEEIRGVVFCVYKSEGSNFGVEKVYQRLAELYGEEKLSKYYGGDEKAALRDNMRRFNNDEAKIMVATKAFGMGIDKRNIRYTVHFGITNSIEAYYQEAGRAGRDGEKAMSYILLSNDMPERNEALLEGVDIMDLGRELRKVRQDDRDDLDRVLFLHQMNFDKKRLLRNTRRLLERVGKISTKRDFEKHVAAENRMEFKEFQKVLFRLKTLGIVKDYMISDYANNEFLVLYKKFDPMSIVLEYGEYVGRYQEGQKRHEMNKIKRQTYGNQIEFVLAQMEILLDFIDGVFEKSRRRAIKNMLEVAEAGARIKDLDEADKEVRRRILNYLGATNKDLLKTIIDDKKIIQKAKEAIFRVRRTNEASLEAETKRLLSSYPEHPGLLLLVGFLELINEETEVKRAIGDILSAERNSEKYGIAKEEFRRAIVDMVRYSYERGRNEDKYREGVEVLEASLRGKYPDLKERLVGVLPERFCYLFQGELLLENMITNLAKVKYTERDLWTGRS